MKSILILFMAFFVIACEPEEGAAQSPAYKVEKITILTQAGDTHKFKVELATELWQLQRGLMNRTELPEKGGMLFWFGGDVDERSFWMKNTLIPLDMIFINIDGTIRHIHHNAIPHDLTSVKSQGPVAAVLELNGGTAKKLGMASGDIVKHRFFQ